MGNAMRWTPEQLAEFQARMEKMSGKAESSLADFEPTPAPPKPKPRKKLTERQEMISLYLQQIALLGLPAPDREVRFHESRRWRFDFAWPELRLAAEYEGGVYTGGAHTRGKHYEGDCEKYNEAALLGWTLLRFTVNLVKSGKAAEQTERYLKRGES